jgi:hypothetical protein
MSCPDKRRESVVRVFAIKVRILLSAGEIADKFDRNRNFSTVSKLVVTLVHYCCIRLIEQKGHHGTQGLIVSSASI